MSKLNILVAYPYAKPDLINQVANNKNHVRFVLDSGAFTAWKAGKPIQLDDYCRFIESLPFEPWRYFTLDVVGDPVMTMKNYETMLSRGFKPVPIFTRGENPSMIDEYYKTSDVVGIGGLVGTPGNKGFVKGIMKHIGSRRVHWLGFTSTEFVNHYRPYMCDSSSWEYGAKFGIIGLYIGKGKFLKIKFGDIHDKTKTALIINALRFLGFSQDDALNKDNWSGKTLSFPRLLGGASVVKYTQELEQNLGTKQFIALGNVVSFNLINDQYIRMFGT